VTFLSLGPLFRTWRFLHLSEFPFFFSRRRCRNSLAYINPVISISASREVVHFSSDGKPAARQRSVLLGACRFPPDSYRRRCQSYRWILRSDSYFRALNAPYPESFAVFFFRLPGRPFLVSCLALVRLGVRLLIASPRGDAEATASLVSDFYSRHLSA
jgi:hypothetical protein